MIYISDIRTTAPENIQNPTEKKVFAILDKLKIAYECVENDVVETMEECIEIDKALGTEIRKSIFLCNKKKTSFFLVVMPANKSLDTNALSKKIGVPNLSFASAEDMEKYLDIHPGAVSVMGLMNDHDNMVQLLVDEDVLKGEYMGCHPCVNTSSMKLKTADVFTTYLEAVHHKAVTVVLKGE